MYSTPYDQYCCRWFTRILFVFLIFRFIDYDFLLLWRDAACIQDNAFVKRSIPRLVKIESNFSIVYPLLGLVCLFLGRWFYRSSLWAVQLIANAHIIRPDLLPTPEREIGCWWAIYSVHTELNEIRFNNCEKFHF